MLYGVPIGFPGISKTDMPCDPPVKVYEVTSSFNNFSSRLLLLEVEHLTHRTLTINEPGTFLGIEGGFS